MAANNLVLIKALIAEDTLQLFQRGTSTRLCYLESAFDRGQSVEHAVRTRNTDKSCSAILCILVSGSIGSPVAACRGHNS